MMILTGLMSLALVLSDGPIAVTNSEFTDWRGGQPVGWSTSIGAQNGNGPTTSAIEPIAGGGVALSGTASTQRWQLLSQVIEVKPGQTLRLKAEARAVGVRRQGRQYDNCYIGLLFRNAQGGVIAIKPSVVRSTSFAEGELTTEVPAASDRVEVAIFLSQTGRLEVRSVEVETLGRQNSFQVLIDAIGREYSYLAHSGVDWPSWTERFREPAENAESPSAFVKAIRPMLRQLEDPHVLTRLPGGVWTPTHLALYRPNGSPRSVARQLVEVTEVPPLGLVGRTGEGIGYVGISSMVGDRVAVDRLEAAVRELFDAPALIIDLRANRGGDERIGQRIAGLFTSTPIVYARQQYRHGPEPTDLTPPVDRVLKSRGSPTYDRPMAGLIGPATISSGEGFALMLDALPQVKLFGQPTRGASGNPKDLTLPNGVVVRFSTWVALDANGVLIEDRGVLPDVVVDHQGPGDPTFDAAVLALQSCL